MLFLYSALADMRITPTPRNFSVFVEGQNAGKLHPATFPDATPPLTRGGWEGSSFLCKNTLFLLFSANPMPFFLLFISFSLCFMFKTTSGYPFDAHFFSVNYRQLAVNFIENMVFLFF